MADQAFPAGGIEEQAARAYVRREQYGMAMIPHVEAAFLQGIHWERLHRAAQAADKTAEQESGDHDDPPSFLSGVLWEQERQAAVPRRLLETTDPVERTALAAQLFGQRGVDVVAALIHAGWWKA